MEDRAYADAYRASIDDPEAFWHRAAEQIDWFEFPTSILDNDANGTPCWCRGGKLNTAWLALDRHVAAEASSATLGSSARTFLGAHFGGFRDEMSNVLLLDMATFDQLRFLTVSDAVTTTKRGNCLLIRRGWAR